MIKTYFDRYKELRAKYKIGTNRLYIKARGESEDDYDVIVEYCGTGYAHKKYRVIKNKPNLSNQDLAIICDDGNLCFGYRMEGGLICVHTD